MKELKELERYLKIAFGEDIFKYIEIKQALTPPTADEVCKKLSEHFANGVFYDKLSEHFYTITKNKRIVIAYCSDEESKSYTINFEMEAKELVMIGRFYEGLEK